jgi:hypothetical protein
MDVALQFAQVENEFEPRIAKLFKQAGSKIKPDLREIILLDSQSTMDLFCNAALEIWKSQEWIPPRTKMPISQERTQ